MRPRNIALRLAVLTAMTLAGFRQGHASGASSNDWKDLIGPAHVHLRAIVDRASAAEPAETVMQRAIRAADDSFTVGELTAIVRISSICCNRSAALSSSMTRWLRENHPIYSGRLPTEVNQFRGFLLSSLGAFPPNEELYSYVKTEFLFGAHPFNVAAAAVAARSFPDKSDELAPLMEPFLGSSFEDESVDVTTPELNYPLAHPTRARYEIIRTLTAYGPRAYRSLPMLDAITACRNCGSWGSDSGLQRQAAEAAAHIRKVTPPCCRKPAATLAARGLQLIDKGSRKPIVAARSLKLLDQDGQSLRLADLRGRPFVLTFFYSQCTNQLKCVSTVRRLRDLAAECVKDDLGDRVGIYGMTYDAHFDTPSILKQYGKMHGMTFSRNVRLLKTVDDLGGALRDQLELRVSYGAGSVNQHGIQLFVFDKKQRLAAVNDNELWATADVKNCLAKLAAE